MLDQLLANAQGSNEDPVRLLIAAMFHLGGGTGAASIKFFDQQARASLLAGVTTMLTLMVRIEVLPLTKKAFLPSLASFGFRTFLSAFLGSQELVEALPSLPTLTSSLVDAFGAHEKAPWYVQHAATSVSVLTTALDPIGGAARASVSNLHHAAQQACREVNGSQTSSLVDLHTDDDESLKEQCSTNLNIVYSKEDPAAVVLRAKLLTILNAANYRVRDEFDFESLDSDNGAHYVILVSESTLTDPSVRMGIVHLMEFDPGLARQKNAHPSTFVLVEGSRWRSAVDANAPLSRFPPVEELSVTARASMLVHSEAHWDVFLRHFLYSITKPHVNSRLDQHPERYIPFITKLLGEQPADQVEAPDSHLAKSLHLVTLCTFQRTSSGWRRPSYKFDEFVGVTRSMPRKIIQSHIEALLHRLCLLHSMPLHVPGRQSSIRCIVHLLSLLAREEEFCIWMRQMDPLHILAVISSLSSYSGDVELQQHASSLLDFLMNFLAPPHPHRMQWVSNSKRFRCSSCFRRPPPGVVGHFDCEECMEKGLMACSTCERCHSLQDSALRIARAHACASNGNTPGGVQVLQFEREFCTRTCTRPYCKRSVAGPVYACPTCPTYGECVNCYANWSQIRLSFTSTQHFRSVASGRRLVKALLDVLRMDVSRPDDVESNYGIPNAECALAAATQTYPSLLEWGFQLGAGAIDRLIRKVQINSELEWTRSSVALQYLQGEMKKAASKSSQRRVCEFPIMFLFESTDAAAAASSVRLSIEQALPGKIWDESSTIGTPDRVVAECEKCIVLLTRHALESPFILAMLTAMVHRGAEANIVLIKMDGCTWLSGTSTAQMFPPVTSVSADLRPFLSRAVDASLAQLRGEEDLSIDTNRTIVRYSRDYYSSFIRNLLLCLQDRVPLTGIASLVCVGWQWDRFYNDNATASLPENLHHLVTALALTQFVMNQLDEFEWRETHRSSATSASSVFTTVLFQVGALTRFASLYDSATIFSLAQPQLVAQADWQQVVRLLVTCISMAGSTNQEA